VLVKKNLIKVIIGLSIVDTGINLFLIALGYIKGGTAPIFSKPGLKSENMVDPVPQALVLTAIVIGVAVLALALALAIKLYKHYGTLDLRKIKELKW
jgi:multicomponent Na+:H+ antiporter subunit C